MKKLLSIITLLFLVSASFAQTVKTPEEFLGYALGDRFTRHHRVLEYYQHVADALPNVEMRTYGESYEHRPLKYAIVTSPENFARLEQIRQDNLIRAGIASGTPATQVAIVWLSYNVHGNESSSLEAAMKTLYELTDANNAKAKEWLKNTVVILDPCINPDGRDRYANFYNQYGNKTPNPNYDAKEHREPWPGGRANHYLFDLNRDWAWITQQESQQRLKVYNQWMPHVHVDFHEQGYNNPYYFAPAAEPYHGVITPWQREFQVTIGKNHAKYFDKEGWLYFTREVFDLYYPSYGDSYPTFNGAIGMTYEQAGGGAAGLSITTREGDPLTLKDRLQHHHTTGISTVEITAQHAARVITEFEKYFKDNINNPAAAYKTYVIKGDNNADKLNRLANWMNEHGIQFGYASASRATKGFDYTSQSVQSISVSTNDIVISAYQPRSRFITTLFEPQSKLPDSLTYDITAWNLMYAYGLKGYALNERITAGKPFEKIQQKNEAIAKPYAYLFRYESFDDAVFLGQLLKHNITVRTASQPFKINNESFDRGTLIVTRRNNERVADFDNIVQQLASTMNRKMYASASGMVDSGSDFGSGTVNFIKAPRVAMLFGEQTSSLSAGEIWYYFEQQLNYPVTQLGTEYFRNVDLSKYDVLVVPEGYYRMFDEGTLGSVQEWVSNGGRLIVIANAINAFADQKGFGLKRYATDDARKKAEDADNAMRKKEGLIAYADAERKYISEYISGAIYKVTLDKTHPLAYGVSDYYTLKTNELRFDFMENGWNVGTLRGKVKPVQGFAGANANKRLENTISFAVENKGRGNIIYFVDNPLFRCFWENGKHVFANAVFMVGAN